MQSHTQPEWSTKSNKKLISDATPELDRAQQPQPYSSSSIYHNDPSVMLSAIRKKSKKSRKKLIPLKHNNGASSTNLHIS